MIDNSPVQLIRLPAVMKATARGRSAIYSDMAAGTFPRPVRVGERAVAWPDKEVYAVINARIAGKPDHQIRALVRDLMAARKKAS